MSNVNQYTELIAGAPKRGEKYKEWIYVLTQPLDTARQRLIDLQNDFAIETAVGDQLDAIGVRVGISRTLPVKLTGVYFALDDVGGVGLDLGVWKGQFDPDDGTTTLGDETYRAVIQSKVLMNQWDGQNGTLPDFLSRVFGYFDVDGKAIDLQDLQNMHLAINLTQSTTPPIVWELISRRIIDVVAAGVTLVLTDNNPWFGLDYDTDSVKGLDEGYWFPFMEAQ